MPERADYRSWTNHDGGYFVCSHTGCNKKVNAVIKEHDCCGRCRAGRPHLNKAINNYDGPGSFAHKYWEGIPKLGVCSSCGLAPDACRVPR